MSETFDQELGRYFNARFTLVVIVTDEEDRAADYVAAACAANNRELLEWDLAIGLRKHSEVRGSSHDPNTLLEDIIGLNATDRRVYLLRDFHDAWKADGTKRLLRTAAQTLKTKAGVIVVTTPISAVPIELREEAVVVDLPLPDASELGSLLESLPKGKDAEPAMQQRYVRAALGLTVVQARRAFGEALVARNGLDDEGIRYVTQRKRDVLRESEALEFISIDESPDNVGGLDVLKTWLRRRERALSKEAETFGLPRPKGVALIGVPGTGKSLTAKLVSSMWRMPLLRLDVGALFGSLVGESEERLRRAIHLAETIAPCVLWIDEIEKGLAGGDLDGGTSQRVFSSILSWMQEKTAPVFIIATANDVSRLPPELLRRGRFDETFFLDLPTQSEREEILRVHLRRRKRNPENFDIELLAKRTERYVGAELEQCVIDAMYQAFEEGQREVGTDDIIHAIEAVIPLSHAQRERIEGLRSWLETGRARSASFVEKEEAKANSVNIEFRTYL